MTAIWLGERQANRDKLMETSEEYNPGRRLSLQTDRNPGPERSRIDSLAHLVNSDM
jgi:hypothetical protein